MFGLIMEHYVWIKHELNSLQGKTETDQNVAILNGV